MQKQKVRNELRQTQDCEYSRPGRISKLKYVGYWQDSYHREIDNWKDKRRTQYRDEPRGEYNEIEFDNQSWRKKYRLERYLKEQEIPFRVEVIRETVRHKKVLRKKRVKDRQVPNYIYGLKYSKKPDGTKYLARVVKHQSGYSWKYLDITLDKPEVRYYNKKVTIGFKVIWWSNKDIGMEYILRRTER